MKLFIFFITAAAFLFFGTIDLSAQWIKTNGPFGGTTVSCFAKSGEKLYAGSDSRGAFLSTDNGESWESLNSNLPDINIISLAAVGDTVFAGTYNSLFVSFNSGKNWDYAGSGIPANTRVYSIALFDSIIFAGTSSAGIYRSTDHGNTWTNVHSGFANWNTTSFVQDGEKFFADIDFDGIYLSTDRGLTWQQSFSTTSLSGPLFIKDGVVFDGCLYASSDNGEKWDSLKPSFSWEINSTAKSGNYIFAGSGDKGVFISADNGKSWKAVNKGLVNQCVNVIYAVNSTIYASTLKGVFKTTDYGQNWKPVNLRYNDTYVSSLLYYNSNLYAGTDAGIFLSTDDGSNWIPLNNGLTSYDISCLAANGTYIFAGTANGLFRSSDNGLNWMSVNSGLSDINITALNEDDNVIFAANISDTLFASADNGTNWSSLTPLGFFPVVPRFSPSSIAVIGSDIFVGTRGFGVYRSSDDGKSWTSIANGLSDQTVYSLTANNNNLYAGTRTQGVFLSTDNGENWNSIAKGLTNPTIHSLLISNNILYAGTSLSVCYSIDNGANWKEWNDGLTYLRTAIKSLYFLDTVIYAGTFGYGVWRRPVSEIITSVRTTSPPSSFSLAQNYPNPFNPMTKIKYSIPDVQTHGYASVRLEIYDMLGRKIAILVNKKQRPGNYEVTFDGSKLASGIYFYRLISNNNIITKKMILLK